MIWTYGRLCAVLALAVVLVACGSDDDSTGADSTSTVPSEITATSAGSPPSGASPTMTSASSIATPTSEPTVASSPEASASPSDEAGAELEYEELSAWDARWEGLGAMVFGPDGRLYIDDYVQKQMMVFTADGEELPPFEYSAAIPEKAQPRNDFAIGPNGRIYLLEQSAATRVQVFEPDGTLVNEWGGTVGFDDESLFDARTIAVAADGHIFTARAGALLQKFTNDGEFVAAWDRAGEYLFPTEVYDMEIKGETLYLAATGYRDDQSVILTFDLDGNLIAEPLVVGESDDEDRIVPWSLAIGPVGNLFIADLVAREVIVLTPDGNEVTRWQLATTDERFPSVEVAVDEAGRVYVADDALKSIVVYATRQADASP